MPRPLTPAQAAQNRAFLKKLARAGNVRLACRELSLKYGTMQHRRRVSAGFAARWDAALVLFDAQLAKAAAAGRSPLGAVGTNGRSRVAPSAARPLCSPLRAVRYKRSSKEGKNARSASLSSCPAASFRTAGGEMTIVRTRDGRYQVQRAKAGRLTREAEQAFLSAVSATCNMSLAAAAVGSCFGAFNRRRRKDPGFAMELRMALRQGFETLELALFESSLPSEHEYGDWRHNDPPAMPPMTANQGLQLMYLHHKAVLQLDEPDYLKRRRGESREAHGERLAAMADERDARARFEFQVAEAGRAIRGEDAWGPAGEDVRRQLGLVDLAQVTGRSPALDISFRPLRRAIAYARRLRPNAVSRS